MNTESPLWRALEAAHARLAGAGEFPTNRPWEPAVSGLGTEDVATYQHDNGSVPRVLCVPTQKQHRWPHMASPEAVDAAAEWDERAAILEFEAGLDREEAERQTALALGSRPR